MSAIITILLLQSKCLEYFVSDIVSRLLAPTSQSTSFGKVNIDKVL